MGPVRPVSSCGWPVSIIEGQTVVFEGSLRNEISSILQCASETILYRVNCGSWHCGLEGLGAVLSIYKSLYMFYVIA